MSVPDDLRPEFEAFRDETRRGLAELRAVTAERDDAILKATSRSMQALRETQLEHGRTLDEHSAMLRDLTAVTAALAVGQAELSEDVAQLRTGQEVLWAGLDEVRADIAGLRADGAELRTDVAGLRTDVTDIRTDVSGLKSDVTDIRTDVADIRTDVTDLKSGMAELLRRLPPPVDA